METPTAVNPDSHSLDPSLDPSLEKSVVEKDKPEKNALLYQTNAILESLHRNETTNELIDPIPPFHTEQGASAGNSVATVCTRCKKQFELAFGKNYKLCDHCRDLQRQRSRRWQERTKNKDGACRRCGSLVPHDQKQYVLCPSCRESLRSRKANRAAQGKCVHCSGPNDNLENDYKVCKRCRENDRIRRLNLEKTGHCNRCAKALTEDDLNNHKVCFGCRNRKKKSLPGMGDGTNSSAIANNNSNNNLIALAIPPLANYNMSSTVVQAVQQINSTNLSNFKLDNDIYNKNSGSSSANNVNFMMNSEK